METTKPTFTISYDDQPDDIVSKISFALSEFNLMIVDDKGGDSYMTYKVVPVDNKTDEKVHDNIQ